MTSHINELVVEEGPYSHYSEELNESGSISITSGIVALAPDVCLTAFDVLLPNPVATDDDYKRLQIVDTAGAAHTVTPATPFGDGGAGEAMATFSGVIGDSLKLMAYGGIWYIIGAHQVTVDTV